MAADPFSFFRGTFHLYARDYCEGTVTPPDLALPPHGPLRIVGDIHGENFGTFKGADGNVHYDINDFDETTWGNLEFDICRSATAFLLAARQIGVSSAKAEHGMRSLARNYAERLMQFAQQPAPPIEGCSDKQLPQADVVRRLITAAADVRRADYIDSLTRQHGDHRTLLRGKKYFDLTAEDRQRVERLLADYVRRLPALLRKEDAFYHVQDIAGRIAGCGSLGRYRFVVLITGHGDDTEKNVLLEFKESLPSALDLCRPQPAQQVAESQSANCRAAEVIAAEQAMQTVSNRYLGYAVDGSMSFQVREIGPRERRLEWIDVKQEHEFDDVAALHARLLVQSHAKAALSDGATRARLAEIPAVLMPHLNRFEGGIADFAIAYAQQVLADHDTCTSKSRPSCPKRLRWPPSSRQKVNHIAIRMIDRQIFGENGGRPRAASPPGEMFMAEQERCCRMQSPWSLWTIFAAIFACLAVAGCSERGVNLLASKPEPAKIEAAVPADVGFDWPHWRGPDDNGVSRETEWNFDHWPEDGLPVLWQQSIGVGFSSISVAKERAYSMGYANGKDTVWCFDAIDGKEKWHFSYEAKLVDNLHEGGPAATPTVEGNRVYTVSKEGLLLCLSADEGQELWRAEFQKRFDVKMPDWGFSCSPLILDDLLIVDAGCTAAFDKLTGAVRWKTEKFKPGYGSAVSFTHDGQRLIAVLNNEYLLVVRADDGSEVDKFPWVTDYATSSTTPIVDGDTIFISTGYNRGFAPAETGRRQALSSLSKQEDAQPHEQLRVVRGLPVRHRRPDP